MGIREKGTYIDNNMPGRARQDSFRLSSEGKTTRPPVSELREVCAKRVRKVFKLVWRMSGGAVRDRPHHFFSVEDSRSNTGLRCI